MNVLKNVLVLIWRGWFVLLTAVSVLIFGGLFILPFTFRKKDYPIAYFFLRMWAYTVFFGSGLYYRFHSKVETDVPHPAIMIANHTSMMDIMMMYILHKKPIIFVGKKELEKFPVFGKVYANSNILVDRADEKSRMKVLRQCMEHLKRGHSICIFPEGGVPEREVFLDEFKDGPFVTAALGKVPLVVYTFCGMKKRLPYAYFLGGPGKVDVFLNEIIPPDTFTRKQTTQFRDHCKNIIYQQLQDCDA